VDHLRLETLEFGAQQRAVAQTAQIEAHVGLEPDGAAAHGQFNAPHRALVPAARFGTGMDAEQGAAAALGEALQHATGESDTIDLVEAVGE
jgi:hypothetical protein